MERLALHDDVTLEPALETTVAGFADDTIVSSALQALAHAVGLGHGWSVRIDKRIPVAAGLGGGSADAAAALELANATLEPPLAPAPLHAIAASVGADVPFFLGRGAQLATGDGTELESLALPKDYAVLLVVPAGSSKESTRAVYEAFDRRSGALGFSERAARLHDAIGAIADPSDLAALPLNDLASSPLSDDLRALGAFRADVTGAGPTVYGLFSECEQALYAEKALRSRGRTFVTHPVCQ
jgi:4-diphosphocytidyl-2-C-methyl-D-erythritol kinase